MVIWLVPLCLFALFSSIFLGGTPIEPRGGTPIRQVLGLLASLVVYIVIWNVLCIGFKQIASVGPAMGLASLVSIPLLAVACWIGFIIFGIKLGKASAAH